MTTATAQLAFPTDAMDDDLAPDAIAGVEARIRDDDERRSRSATWARPCRCRCPWGDLHDGICGQCGRTVEAWR